MGEALTIDADFPECFYDLWDKECFDGKGWRHYGIWGGRGSGKSHNVAGFLVLEAYTGKHIILCAREFQNSIDDSVKALIEQKIKDYGLEEHFYITNTQIECLTTGSRFIFRGMKRNINSIKSIEGITYVWLEEAQTLSKQSLKILTPTIRAAGSRLIYTWNPLDPSDPIEQMLRPPKGKAPPRSIIKRVNHDMNPYFPSELQEEMETDFENDPELAEHTWHGAYFTMSNASVFKNWSIKAFDSPDDKWRRFYLGLDFGYSIDPSVMLRMFIKKDEPQNLYIDYEAYKVGVEIEDMPDFLIQNVPECQAWPTVADSARPEIISYLRRKKFNITGALKGKDSIMEGIKWLQTKNIIVHPRCINVINELKRYKFKVDERTDEILPILEDKDNHCIDAMRYAMEKVRRGKALQDVL